MRFTGNETGVIGAIAAGNTAVIRGPLRVKLTTDERPPPGAGFMTSIDAMSGVAIRVAGTAAVREVALPKVVVNDVPFQRITDPFTNWDPVAVRVKPGPPANADDGEIEFIIGTALIGGPGATPTVNVAAFAAGPPLRYTTTA